MEVEMKIRGLMMDPVTNMPIVILKDINGNTVLPIWVGVYEANAIALEIEKVSTPRPMTHDLIKNLLTGRVLDKTFKSGETFEEADVTTVNMQFLYSDGTTYSFMNTQNYEQIEITKDAMDDAAKFLLENAVCEVSFWGEKVISVTPPTFVDLVVTYTEPAVRGDTANNVTKKATLETGAEIDIPMFIETGTKIKIDTRTGEYLQRTT